MTARRPPVLITPGLPAKPALGPASRTSRDNGLRRRSVLVALSVATVFVAIAAQLINLALEGRATLSVAMTHPIAESFSRPDIVDRKGRLLATDVAVPSLYADPSHILDRDDVIEKLARVLPNLDRDQLRVSLADRKRRFVWIRRGLSPAMAQKIHNLGVPGLAFRHELRRAYPLGELAGHTLGTTNIDNKGISGIERYIDTKIGVDPVVGTSPSDKPPVRLTLDVGVLHAVREELGHAMVRYDAKGAAGLVLDVETGAVVASVSLPGIDPMVPSQIQDSERTDKIAFGSFELGSIFKPLTVAMALEVGLVTLKSRLDVSQPLVDGRFTIRDTHSAKRSLTVAEVFTHSSNIGAGMLGLAAGPERHRAFLETFRLLHPIETEAGPVAPPQVPSHWRRIEQITISYGHGLAVAPIQFAAAAAALMNGGDYIQPTFLERPTGVDVVRQRVLSATTSRKINALMRLNVTDPAGTGSRADVPGYRVGGKTGTAEIAAAGGYQKNKVISSFVAGFPMEQPRYLVLVSLFEPTGNQNSGGRIVASRNAAPTTARVIRRIAPMLDVPPKGDFAALRRSSSFDG